MPSYTTTAIYKAGYKNRQEAKADGYKKVNQPSSSYRTPSVSQIQSNPRVQEYYRGSGTGLANAQRTNVLSPADLVGRYESETNTPRNTVDHGDDIQTYKPFAQSNYTGEGNRSRVPVVTGDQRTDERLYNEQSLQNLVGPDSPYAIPAEQRPSPLTEFDERIIQPPQKFVGANSDTLYKALVDGELSIGTPQWDLLSQGQPPTPEMIRAEQLFRNHQDAQNINNNQRILSDAGKSMEEFKTSASNKPRNINYDSRDYSSEITSAKQVIETTNGTKVNLNNSQDPLIKRYHSQLIEADENLQNLSQNISDIQKDRDEIEERIEGTRDDLLKEFEGEATQSQLAALLRNRTQEDLKELNKVENELQRLSSEYQREERRVADATNIILQERQFQYQVAQDQFRQQLQINEINYQRDRDARNDFFALEDRQFAKEASLEQLKLNTPAGYSFQYEGQTYYGQQPDIYTDAVGDTYRRLYDDQGNVQSEQRITSGEFTQSRTKQNIIDQEERNYTINDLEQQTQLYQSGQGSAPRATLGGSEVQITAFGSNAWKYGLDVSYTDGNVTSLGAGNIIDRVPTNKSGGFGNQVAVKHGDGSVSVYSHLAGFDFPKDGFVEKGGALGVQGNTGTVLKADGSKPTREEIAQGVGTHTDITVYKNEADYRAKRNPLLPKTVANKFLQGDKVNPEEVYYRKAAQDIFDGIDLIANYSKDDGKAQISRHLANIRQEYLDSGDPVAEIRATSGFRLVTDSTSKRLSDSNKSIDSIHNLSSLLDEDEKESNLSIAPFTSIFRSNNPYDRKAKLINAQLQTILPRLARGVYGEVGVLTDQDIVRYERTLPNLSQPEDVRNGILLLALKSIKSGYENDLITQKNAKRDVSGFADSLIDVNQKISSIEDRLGIGDDEDQDILNRFEQQQHIQNGDIIDGSDYIRSRLNR